MYRNKDFIKLLENEIKVYISDEKEYDSVKENENGVLDYLNSIDEADVEEMAESISKNEFLYETIREMIDYMLYSNFKEIE